MSLIRTRFMKNPFTIGFNNKSPLNQYKSSMPQSFDLPTLGESYTNPEIPDNSKLLQEEMKIGESIIEAGNVIAQAAGENVARKRKKEQTALDEEKKKQDAINKIPKGSFAHKTLDPDGYETYNNAMNELEEEREIERKENVRKSILKEYKVPDFSNLTGTTDDLHNSLNTEETEADWLAKDKKKHPWDYHLGFPVVR
tara:strand:+ start:672 stop:1265 length:594 start_codon:yes stop_codon:yes gene_type:complete